MKRKHLPLLFCFKCQVPLHLESGQVREHDIYEGVLRCPTCDRQHLIEKGIPRFVPKENYASGFGFQWNKHARTQLDQFSGTNISEERFFKETKWPRTLTGEVILEVGCGAGRFTEQALKTGATTVALDYSTAVDANYRSHGHHENALIVQASVYEMPFKSKSFDRAFCFGVLQHTPEVKRSFDALVDAVKVGGHLAVDIYRKDPWTPLTPKYLLRPLTKKIPHEKLYRVCEAYVKNLWPLTRWVHKLPRGGKINQVLFMISDYSEELPLNEQQLREWAVLDTFDRLAPAHDHPQTVRTLKSWFQGRGLQNIEVHKGYNGVEGRGVVR